MSNAATVRAQKFGVEAKLLIGDSAGIYIPKEFVEGFLTFEELEQEDEEGEMQRLVTGFNHAENNWKINGLTLEDIQILLDPYHEHYWDVWEDVTQNAEYTDPNGIKWTLWQDGDLWAVPTIPCVGTPGHCCDEQPGLREVALTLEEGRAYRLAGNIALASVYEATADRCLHSLASYEVADELLTVWEGSMGFAPEDMPEWRLALLLEGEAGFDKGKDPYTAAIIAANEEEDEKGTRPDYVSALLDSLSAVTQS